MVKTLIVMRHGKALPLAQDQQDIDRQLTEAGAQSLVARLPYQLGLLEVGGGTTRLWSSPAERALQTAGILKGALKERHVRIDGDLEPHECLWEQDVDAFLYELYACDADTVFAVGHVPFAEDVVEALVGTTPPFSTGGLACLEVPVPPEGERDTADPSYAARLLWFAQGPVSQDWKTLSQLQEALAATADNVEKRREAFFADPEDIETMHKFRVSIRTLRSLVAFIKPWQEPQQNAKTQALLKEIVGYTSRQRELDVFEEQAQANESSSPELLEFCRQEAAAERERVQQALASKRLTKSLKKALALAGDISWKQTYLDEGLPQQDVRSQFDAMIASIGAALDSLRLSDEERTHEVRKRAKRGRYAAEHFSAILGEDAVGIAKGMTAHQDNLGAVCDARVNIHLISEFLQRDLPEPVVWDLTLLRAQNETFLYSALKADEARA